MLLYSHSKLHDLDPRNSKFKSSIVYGISNADLRVSSELFVFREERKKGPYRLMISNTERRKNMEVKTKKTL